jgi:hypothetical protein
MSLLIVLGTVAKILNRRLERKILLHQSQQMFKIGSVKSPSEPVDFSLLSVQEYVN